MGESLLLDVTQLRLNGLLVLWLENTGGTRVPRHMPWIKAESIGGMGIISLDVSQMYLPQQELDGSGPAGLFG